MSTHSVPLPPSRTEFISIPQKKLWDGEAKEAVFVWEQGLRFLESIEYQVIWLDRGVEKYVNAAGPWVCLKNGVRIGL